MKKFNEMVGYEFDTDINNIIYAIEDEDVKVNRLRFDSNHYVDKAYEEEGMEPFVYSIERGAKDKWIEPDKFYDVVKMAYDRMNQLRDTYACTFMGDIVDIDKIGVYNGRTAIHESHILLVPLPYISSPEIQFRSPLAGICLMKCYKDHNIYTQEKSFKMPGSYKSFQTANVGKRWVIPACAPITTSLVQRFPVISIEIEGEGFYGDGVEIIMK